MLLWTLWQHLHFTWACFWTALGFFVCFFSFQELGLFMLMSQISHVCGWLLIPLVTTVPAAVPGRDFWRHCFLASPWVYPNLPSGHCLSLTNQWLLLKAMCFRGCIDTVIDLLRPRSYWGASLRIFPVLYFVIQIFLLSGNLNVSLPRPYIYMFTSPLYPYAYCIKCSVCLSFFLGSTSTAQHTAAHFLVFTENITDNRQFLLFATGWRESFCCKALMLQMLLNPISLYWLILIAVSDFFFSL